MQQQPSAHIIQTASATITAKTIAKAALLAGTLDITAAHVKYAAFGGTNPLAVLRFVASGLLGKEALSGGIGTALVGLAVHYVIATTWTGLFFLAYPHVPLLRRSVIASGLGYGCVVWCVMNLFVLPLTGAPALTYTPSRVALEMVILMLCIGLPVAWMARMSQRFSAQNKRQSKN
jgi:hypothetical protein